MTKIFIGILLALNVYFVYLDQSNWLNAMAVGLLVGDLLHDYLITLGFRRL
jgi:hypothetical protein